MPYVILPAPSKPVDLKVIATEKNSITITWEKPLNPNGIIIKCAASIFSLSIILSFKFISITVFIWFSKNKDH